MNEFDYDVRQRKQLARMAKYKKNGSKSKKCSLPSDGMTKKEWKERCGKVMSYNIKKPMTYEQFKCMPKDLQLEYIVGLTTTYKVGLSKIAEMMGVCSASLRNFIKSHLPEFDNNNHGGRMSKDSILAWDAFLNGEAVVEFQNEAIEIPAQEDVVEFTLVERPDASVEQEDESEPDVQVLVEQAIEEPERAKDRKSVLREFSLAFEGNIDALAIANSITAILGTGSVGRVEIRYAM